MLELHLEFLDGDRRAFVEHPGFERAALVGLYLWLRQTIGPTSAGSAEMAYYNGLRGEAVPVRPASVRHVELQLDGEDVGGQVMTGEMP